MAKSRKRQLEEEAKKEGLTPTKELEVDESNLGEEEKGHFVFPWFYLFLGVGILVVMGIIIAVIFITGGPVSGGSENLTSNVTSAITSNPGGGGISPIR